MRGVKLKKRVYSAVILVTADRVLEVHDYGDALRGSDCRPPAG